MHSMDRVLFGDNQFFGVNHMSEDKARSQSMRFRDTAAIIDVLDAAYQEGIRTFMCTTHDRIADVCQYFRENGSKYPDYRFYPCMPYAHKYANAVTEHGMLDALRLFLPQDGAMSAMIKGGMALATKDVDTILCQLVDAEMKMFKGLTTPVVFMQNVITDLLLGLEFYDAFAIFDRHVRERYGAEPGFITMNLPRLLDVLEERSIRNPIVCANVNKIGFRMCGGLRRTRMPSTTGSSGRSRCRCLRPAPSRRARRSSTSARCRVSNRSSSAHPVAATFARRNC